MEFFLHFMDVALVKSHVFYKEPFLDVRINLTLKIFKLINATALIGTIVDRNVSNCRNKIKFENRLRAIHMPVPDDVSVLALKK